MKREHDTPQSEANQHDELGLLGMLSCRAVVEPRVRAAVAQSSRGERPSSRKPRTTVVEARRRCAVFGRRAVVTVDVGVYGHRRRRAVVEPPCRAVVERTGTQPLL
ncbi:hypothetical protein PsYK624_146090 [Phanerochaete sordida]|uniref:Uncharacterized protein n=1 Tax=Phanerochaete sordida TaxID=48140 RepID=A0A9P3LKI5_9APHY|nr:hypothetical protein PsYK624_146090 [Phanerochaete sordida]